MTKQELINQINSVIRDKTEDNSITPEMVADVLTNIVNSLKEDITNVNFTGEFNVSHGTNLFYNDYIEGPEVNLTITPNIETGSVATVRIKGDLLGTIPEEWNLSGDSVSRDLTILNEITLMVVSIDDVRLVNRIIEL